MLGGHSALDPPLPIPNRTVKQSCADDSALPVCESRSPPGSPFQRPLPKQVEGVCVYPQKHLSKTPPNTYQKHATAARKTLRLLGESAAVFVRACNLSAIHRALVTNPWPDQAKTKRRGHGPSEADGHRWTYDADLIASSRSVPMFVSDVAVRAADGRP